MARSNSDPVIMLSIGSAGLLIVALLLVFVQPASCRNEWKHAVSNFRGLNRRIVLYDANGQPIRQWETQAKVEDKGGTCYFLDAKGKAITISGTFVIEEQ